MAGNTEVGCTPGQLNAEVQKGSEPEIVLNGENQTVLEKGTVRKNRNKEQVEYRGKNKRKANMNLVSTPKTRNPFKKQPLTSMTKEADSGKKSRFFPTTLILQLLLPKYKLFTLCKCISALGCLKQDSISSALRGPFI